MPKKKKKRCSGELSEQAISEKSRSHANGVFRGIGERPNKQETARRRESGDRAVFRKCYDTCPACRLLFKTIKPLYTSYPLSVI